MYDDIGDYIPDVKRRSTTHNDRHKNPHEHDNAKKVYFHNSSKSAPADEPGPGGADAVKSFNPKCSQQIQNQRRTIIFSD